MADTEFDLGEALGGYEQAQADRNFYLSMVQGGTQMASPIAAYLAGVSGVKMANMRAKAQAIEDKRTAEKDALAATEKAQKRAMDLDNQIINIMKGARDGSIAPSAAAGMLGYVMKERGYIPKGYDADNNVMTYGVPGDEQDYQFDLGESETVKEKGLNKRANLRAQEAKERQERGIQGQKDVAEYKAGLKKENVSKSGASVSNKWQAFKTAHQPLIDIINGKDILNSLEDVPTRRLEAFVNDYKDEFGIEDTYNIVTEELDRRLQEYTKEPEIKETKKAGILSRFFSK